jgi:hypothetical protein
MKNFKIKKVGFLYQIQKRNVLNFLGFSKWYDYTESDMIGFCKHQTKIYQYNSYLKAEKACKELNKYGHTEPSNIINIEIQFEKKRKFYYSAL